MRTVVVLLGCVVVLAGCVGAPSPSPSPSPSVSPGSGGSASPVASPSVLPSVSPSPAVSPTPTPTSFPSYPADLPTQDPETAAIIHGWQEYWRVYDKFAADPLRLTDLTETQYVTTGRQSSIVHTSIANIRDARVRSEGGQVFRDVRVGAVMKTGEARQAEVTYCADSAYLRVFDIDTGERLPRSGTYRETATMEEGIDGQWRVALIQNEEGKC